MAQSPEQVTLQGLATEMSDMRSTMMGVTESLLSLERLLGRRETPVRAEKEEIPPFTERFGEGNSRPRKVLFEEAERRRSALDQLVEDSGLKAPTVIHYHQKFSGKMLADLELKNVLAFIEDVSRYEASEGTKAPIGTLITSEAMQRLAARSQGRLSYYTGFAASAKVIVRELQRCLRPESPIAFFEAVSRSVYFTLPADYWVSPTTFDVFYDALQAYVERFALVCGFLGEDNKANIPNFNNKEFGLLKLFSSKIPHKYAQNLINTLPQTSFSSFELFRREFMEVATRHKVASDSARELMLFFKFDKSMPSEDSRRGEDKNRRRKFSGVHKRDRIMKLEETTQVSQAEALHAVRSGADGAAKANGCYAMVLYNACSATNCGYSHIRAVLERTHTELLDALRKSAYAGKSALVIEEDTLTSESSSGEEELRMLREDVFRIAPEVALARAVHRAGTILTDTDKLELRAEEILFDTGANGSYVSESFWEQYKDVLSPFASPSSRVVRMANRQQVSLSTNLLLRVVFADADGKLHEVQTQFGVVPDLAVHMIIGLPDIVRKVPSLFKQMLEEAVSRFDGAMHMECLPCNVLVEPWSSDVGQEAPEEDEVPVPCAFPEPLRYMEMSRTEALDEFRTSITAHVCVDFLQQTAVRELLLTVGKDVFVPSNWEGIRNIPPLEFNWSADMPKLIKPKARSVNPKLYEPAKREFERLKGYFYRPSDSPIASCIVLAPKATPPYIRFCGDYVGVNRYVERGHFPIPVVKQELGKIIRFPIYLDLDLTNAYHQLRLGPITSRMLSVQTPWGQYEPVFLPEGVSPASGVLQATMRQIFGEYDDFMIVIFDNLLVLCEDYQDAYNKLEVVLRKCIEFNIVLKMSKSFLGFTKVSFFGFECSHKHFELSTQRKQEIAAFVMPANLKQMQRFLGTAGFFSGFVPSFATLAAPLTDMTAKSFNWDRSKWIRDYDDDFAALKEAMVAACALYYPDYSLNWVLRTDASEVGVGAVLFQVATSDGPLVHQPIGFASKKFSDAARRWSTYDQEGYAVFFAVSYFDFYLRCKAFVIETDHRNLQWMENSLVPRVVRWRSFLQAFEFKIRSIPGKENRVADWQSRIHDIAAIGVEPINLTGDERAMLSQVHGGRAGHHGVMRTWEMLQEHFPGCLISRNAVSHFIKTCAVCQKNRIPITEETRVRSEVRHLKVPYERNMVAVDTLTVTPADTQGNRYLIVVVNMFTRFTAMYPATNKSAETMATALLQYFATFGTFDFLRSDPGSDLMSETLRHLQRWIGIRHSVTLVDRPEANGVEPVNRSILRHLRALVYDERVISEWSNPTILAWVQYILNSFVHSETGCSPYDATFGTSDARYFKWPDTLDTPQGYGAYVSNLNLALSAIRDRSRRYQERLVLERAAGSLPAQQLKSGQFVFIKRETFTSKLQPRFEGPFEVVSQRKNDVKIRDLIRGSISEVHVDTLKLFWGTREDAVEMAKLDGDQFLITEFLAYRGDPIIRTSMEFLVQFADGDEVWLPWSKDLFDTVQYETFCREHSELRPLLVPAATATRERKALISTQISEVNEGDIVYVDLRTYGAGWYATLPLPDKDRRTYYLQYVYGKFASSRTRIRCFCPVFDEQYVVDRDFVQRYGVNRKLPLGGILIDAAFLGQYPLLLPTKEAVIHMVTGILRMDYILLSR